MSEKALGHCCVCGKKVYEKDLISGAVVFMKGWPGDGYAHVDHTGIHECYNIDSEIGSKKGRRKKN